MRVRRRKIYNIALAAVIAFAAMAGIFMIKPAKAAALPNIEVGSYVGDGNASQPIVLSTAGFGTPQMVMVQEAPASGSGTAGASYIRIQGMSGTKNMGDGGSSLCSTCVTSIGTGTFNVGSTLNGSGKRYGYTVVTAASGNYDDNFAVGSYAGDTTQDDRNISLGGAAWNPNVMVVVRTGGASVPIWRSSTHSGDLASSFISMADSSNWIQNLSPSLGNFQVGNHANVNATGSTYYWVAFKNLTGSITNGTYQGNGQNDQDITMNDAFRPDYVWTRLGGTQVAANHFIHQDGNNVGQIFLGNYGTNMINTSTASGFRIDNSAYVNSNPWYYHYFALKSRYGGAGVTSTFNQSAYRLFSNTDSTDVGSALAATNTTAVVPQQGTAFRLRMNMHISTSDLDINTQGFKLQVAARGVDNQCDTSFTSETYADVSPSSGAIRYYDNTGVADKTNLTTNANDPTHSGHTNNAQTYNEANNFANNTAAITNGNDGLWDFALVDNSAPNDTTYCFRAVKADGNVLDTYSVVPEVTTSPAGTISITNPTTYKVFQRNGSNQANIALNGTYTTSPTAIEARWNGGSWTTIDASPSGGTYSATLSNQTGGQGTLEVRFSNAITITASKSYIGVGDIYVIAGDSNASGDGANLQTYSHATLKAAMFKNNDSWAELDDPTDSSTGQNIFRASYDSAVTDGSTNKGSIWPLLATKIMADQNVPVAFIPAARWASTVSGAAPTLNNTANWRRYDLSPSASSNLYGDMWTKIFNAGGGTQYGVVKGVIFHEGINDFNIISDGQRANYKTQLNTFVDNIMTNFGVKTMFSLPGDCDPVLYACDIVDGFDNVREVIKEVWNENANMAPGAVFYDIDKTSPMGDGVHFEDNASLQTVTDRLWLALRDEYYATTDARGPQLTTAQYNAAKTDVYLTFTEASLPILPASGAEGIRVYDNGVQATISSVTRTANNTLKVSLASAAAGTVTVSICEYRDCYGQTVITDSSAYNLPVENISGQATTLLSDITAPTGTISINGGAGSTNTASVTLTLSATDDIDPSGSLQMQVSNDSGFAGASWEAYNTSKAWTLTSGVGTRTVYVRYKDGTGNTSSGYSDTITLADNTAPTGSISINSGNATTNSLSATLSLSATDDLDSAGSLQMMISNDAGFSGASWEAYNTSKAWTLSSGIGAKTVYVKYKDSSSNESSSYNDSITVVDNTAPSGIISINGGAGSTNTTSATLTLSASDDFDASGSLQMMISNDSGFSGASWESYGISKAWTLSAGAGVKTVYAKYRDSASNESSSYSDTITLVVTDSTAPTGSISINSGNATTNTTSVTLTLSATDDIDSSGSLQMMVSNDSGFSGASWESYGTSKSWSLTSGAGAKVVYVKYKDSTGNTSSDYADSITLVEASQPEPEPTPPEPVQEVISSVVEGPIVSSPLADDEPVLTEEIVLNDITQYESQDGFNISLQVKEFVRVWVDNQLHKVTLSEVHSDRVVLLIESEPQYVTIKLGQTVELNPDKDKTPDLSATLASISGGQATIIYKKLAANTSADKSTDEQPERRNSPAKARSINLPLIAIGGAGLVLLALALMAVRAKRHQRRL